jgi:phosphotransferase system enzyme I (PtsP)
VDDAPAQDEGGYLLLLKDIADAVAETASLEGALAATVDLAAARLGYDVVSIYLVESNHELVLAATHGLRPESVGKVRMRLSEGLTGLVAETERPIFTEQADEHPRFKFFPETGEERFRSFGGVPLLRRGRCVGVLAVQRVKARRFPANEVMALQTVAQQVVSLVDAGRRLAAPASGSASAPRPAAQPRARGLLAGLGTSAGTGVGVVVVLGVDPLATLPPARPFEGVEEELARFGRARDRAKAELEALATRLEKEHGTAAAAILWAHAELVSDPGLEARVRGLVAEEEEPVERAVIRAVDEFASILGEASPHLAEKVLDLRDVRRALLEALGVAGEREVVPTGAGQIVLVADVLTPAETAHLDPARVAAIVTAHGSETSHASILARSLGIPAVVGVADLLTTVAPGDRVLVDGDNGFVFHEPEPTIEAEYQKRREVAKSAERAVEAELAARLPKGPTIPEVELLANVGLPAEIAAARERGADGIGLLRTEFFYMQQDAWPTVAEQVAFYRRALQQGPKGPVVLRLLDAGGDKALPYAPQHVEPNPILGLRSVRYLLSLPEVAKAQVRAVAEAAAAERADVRVLVPLVTAAWELRAVRDLLEEASAGLGPQRLKLGMMVEAPSVLYQLDHLLPHCDFVSLGTNDLTQYLLAVDRENELVRAYYSPYHPAVMRALDWLGRALRSRGMKGSVCGEMAGDPLGALALLALGWRSLSVRPRAITALRLLVHTVDPATLPGLREELLASETPADAERVLRKSLRASVPALLEA